LAAGELDVIFTVDLFNEGVDVPAIDAVLMLRPTESPVVFFQQLGRGLRRHAGKDRLEVIDLVGNHRSFLLKARLLAELAGRPGASSREAVDLLAEPLTDLPPGCELVVDTEVVDLLRELTRRAGRDRLAGLLTDWVAEHDGRRPTALEFSLHVGDVVGARGSGGWFGLLDRLGLLSPTEAEVYGLARDFLAEVEFGSYTKSWKLVTLLALLDADSLRTGIPNHAAYNAAKGGVLGLTVGLARDWAHLDITVNMVSPCVVQTAHFNAEQRVEPAVAAAFLAVVPKGRAAAIPEVADMVAFLARREAAFMTGQNLSVNGGSAMP
jgi:hypothetical protein